MTRPPDRQQHPSASSRDADRRLLTAARQVRIADVPPELSSALRASFAGRDSLATRIRRTFAAVMQFDGLAGPALAGVRGGSSAARQLVYACEVADVTFLATNEGEGVWHLAGIVLSLDDSDDADDVRYDIGLDAVGVRDETVRSTLTDPAGEFVFTDVGPGEYRMTVTGPDFVIEVGPFELVDALE